MEGRGGCRQHPGHLATSASISCSHTPSINSPCARQQKRTETLGRQPTHSQPPTDRLSISMPLAKKEKKRKIKRSLPGKVYGHIQQLGELGH